jgi:transketolase
LTRCHQQQILVKSVDHFGGSVSELSASELLSLRRTAAAIRLRALRMVAPHKLGYLGQALGAAEQYAVLYSLYRPGLDRLVISPGHYVIAGFAAGAERGLIDQAQLPTYGHNDSYLEAIGGERSPAMDYTCGSLGQGLSAAIGFALSDRLRGRTDARVYASLSDGEMEEGQVWEAAMFAGHHRLEHVTVLIDANNSQVDGPVDTITTIEPLCAKWDAFGWASFDVDGHDVAAVHAAVTAPRSGRPRVIVCRTTTRTGLKCLPAEADGHFITFTDELVTAADTELSDALAAFDA